MILHGHPSSMIHISFESQYSAFY